MNRIQTKMQSTLAKKKNKKGFTLVELVVVIAILAILALIAIPTITNVINTANKNTNASNAQTVQMALKSAYAEYKSGAWTPASNELTNNAPTVEACLKHEGLVNLANMTSRIKGGATAAYYSDNNEIYTNDTAKSGQQTSSAISGGEAVTAVIPDIGASSASSATSST